MLVCTSARAVVSGTGMVMTTLSAKSLLLNPAFTFVFTSMRVRPSSVIRGVTCTGTLLDEHEGMGALYIAACSHAP